MPVSISKNVFAFRELRKNKDTEYDTAKGLPGLLADILPYKYSNQLINR